MSEDSWITIYTDASFNPNTGVSSWAAWIRSVHGLKKASGVCPSKIKDCFMAEFFSIFAGLNVASKLWQPEGAVVVNDNDQAIRCMWPWTKVPNKVQWIKSRIDKLGIDTRTKFVKGHNGGTTVPSWVNEWCDKEAKRIRVQEERKSHG